MKQLLASILMDPQAAAVKERGTARPPFAQTLPSDAALVSPGGTRSACSDDDAGGVSSSDEQSDSSESVVALISWRVPTATPTSLFSD
jgi:hypothetical protein